MQSVHVVDPVTALYCPTGQGEHDVAPYEEKEVPTGQREHARAPTVFEYVPGRQNLQKDPALSLYCPRVQFLQEPKKVLDPAGQS
jgi:hypothetical protein